MTAALSPSVCVSYCVDNRNNKLVFAAGIRLNTETSKTSTINHDQNKLNIMTMRFTLMKIK